MKYKVFILAAILLSMVTQAQQLENTAMQINSAENLLNSNNKLVVGGYGEVHYNQPLSNDLHQNGILDVHRMVVLFGYNFTPKTKFVSEIEYEHVNEVYIEQAFVQHQLTKSMHFRAGLLLIPMGIVNEYHEPTSFFGVERPTIDNKLSPTTWREIGFGVAGNSIATSMRYQAYLVNGFSSFTNETPMLNGKNGLRNGRQKGMESFITSPNIAARLEYYGMGNVVIGASAYVGQTQSTMYHNLKKDDQQAVLRADSSRTGIAMAGLDIRFSNKALQAKAQFYYTAISNTEAYNIFTQTNGKANDLGSAMLGYYIEFAYNVFRHIPGLDQSLSPFIRYEKFDTHFKTEGVLQQNAAYNNHNVVVGLQYYPVSGVVFKADMQWIKTKAADHYNKVLNAGVGIMF